MSTADFAVGSLGELIGVALVAYGLDVPCWFTTGFGSGVSCGGGQLYVAFGVIAMLAGFIMFIVQPFERYS
jgi:hypothetical protein